MRFVERVVHLHDALADAGLPHAFGGAISLAYCTRDPRGTDDIDVNVFVGTRRLPEVIDALPDAIAVTAANRRQLERDAQTRLFWDRTPVDVFLSNHPFHGRSQANSVDRPFEGRELPMLSCRDLAVYKSFSARPRDAVDVAEMVTAACVDPVELERIVRELIGGERDEFLALVREFSEGDDEPGDRF